MLAAGAVLSAAAQPPLHPHRSRAISAIVFLAAAAFFIVNHVLACVGGALLERPADRPLRARRPALSDSSPPAACSPLRPPCWPQGTSSPPLVIVAFLPVLAIYVGGKQAAVNSHLAYHDALTELPNRLLFTERLQAELAGAEHEARRVHRAAARPR